MNKCLDCGSWTTHRAWCSTNREREAGHAASAAKLQAAASALPSSRCGECMRDVRVPSDHAGWCKAMLAQPTAEEIAQAERAKFPLVTVTYPAHHGYSQDQIDEFTRSLRALGSERCTVIPMPAGGKPINVTLTGPNKFGAPTFFPDVTTLDYAPSDGIDVRELQREQATHPTSAPERLFAADPIGEALAAALKSPEYLAAMYGIQPRGGETRDEFAARCRALWPRSPIDKESA